ncbi:signal recognition particle 19 kDa protein [Pararge aegeria]|uniref:Jg18662 protein n=2 Tax=Pararge aegeria TaxID=116150 RepID=A0A8S4RW92_9NEOP|nr:signal recognition particle 19 kDa protein [Pararge aegeria]CAH2243055.1 jg18662 [Pararge aegeria aegeria]
MTAVITSWSPDKKHSDVERWICIYPAYLNNKKTLAQGRRLPKDICIENPTHQEIRDVLFSTGLRIGVENKLYPRERSKEMLYRGRIRVEIKNDDGKPIKEEYPTRESVMKFIVESIPKLKTRQNRPADQQPQSVQQGTNKAKGKKGRR